MILHSYIIVRRVIKLEDRDNAAWLLNRQFYNKKKIINLKNYKINYAIFL